MTALVTGNLALLAGAPDGIAKLRSLIRDLAVAGRLLPREAGHEAWRWSTLGKEIGRMDSGWSPACLETPSPTDDFWGVLRTTSVQPQRYVQEENKQLPPRLEPRPEAEVTVGDVLFTRAGPMNRVGISCLVASTRPKLMLSDKIIRFRPIADRLDGRFTALCLNAGATARYLEGAKSGMATSQVNISQAKLKAAPIPVPPLAEQHRIVAKVDELMALCDRLEAEQADSEAAHAKLVEALLASLTQARDAADFRASWQRLADHFHALFTSKASVDALKQALLQLAVTGRLLPHEAPFVDGSGESIGAIPLPRHWDVVSFNDLVDQNFPIAYGVLVPGPEDADGVPFVRIADLSLNAPPQLPEKRIARRVDAKFSRTRLVGGEILMGVVGSIGKLGIAPPSWAGANIARAICRIVPAPTVCREFVLWLLQSDLMRNQFLGDTRTLAQPTLNVGLIRAARTPLPPLEEQQRIVAMIDQLMALCDKLQRSLVNAGEHHENLASVLAAQAIA